MIRNSILQIIGQKQDINLNQEQARQVEAIFSDGDIPNEFVVRLTDPSISFKKGTIRSIEVRRDGGKSEFNQKNFDDFYEEERLNRKKYLSWTKERLASYTDIFEGLYKISAGENPKEEDIERARQVQLVFFKENNQRTMCDPYLFKPLIPMTISSIDIWQSGFFRLVEKAVFRDMQISGQFKKPLPIPIHEEPRENENIEDMKNRAIVNREMDEKFNQRVNEALNS